MDEKSSTTVQKFRDSSSFYSFLPSKKRNFRIFVKNVTTYCKYICWQPAFDSWEIYLSSLVASLIMGKIPSLILILKLNPLLSLKYFLNNRNLEVIKDVYDCRLDLHWSLKYEIWNYKAAPGSTHIFNDSACVASSPHFFTNKQDLNFHEFP